MARKATEYKETNEVVAMPDEALHQAHAITLANEAELHAIKGEYSEERDVINQILGQVQMARSFARFADVVSLQKLAHIKETKAYKARLAAAKRTAKDVARGRAIELWPKWNELRAIEAGQAFADAALSARFGGAA